MPNLHTAWSSAASSSSSIYSQEEILPADNTPLISRKDSSSSSKASTVYSEDTIKSLGYKPFEYWKGPRPVAYPGDMKKNKRAIPTAPRITGVNLTGPINSLHDFKPMPDAKIREVKIYMDAVPPSPTVKDRYAQRRAERARRKRQADRRVEEWPGWVPDQKVYGVSRSRRVRLAVDGATARSVKRYSDVSTILPPVSQKWWNPRTWRRRWWGIVFAIIMLVIIASIITATIVTRDNEPDYPNYKRLNYRVAETYNTEDFFDHFNYFTGPDPSHGFVHYASRPLAKALNLTYMTTTSAVLRVDTSVGNTSVRGGASTGRHSVRVTSKQQFRSGGLFSFDVVHTPLGCGTWPALLLGDPANRPAHGEMDVMEATNLATTGNAMSLHTGAGCDMTNRVRNMTGVASVDDNCDASAAGDAGCGVAGDASTYGAEFNAGGGGVMAVEWRTEGIRMWQFARGNIPSDLRSGTSPDPSLWGRAMADFPSTGCNVNSHFRNQSIIMNINLCGEADGAKYAASGCPSNCTDYVANNPKAFQNAYWEFGTLKVYQAI